jgi:hypothetical protein
MNRYVLVQFIEIGGDHLDSLMSADQEVRTHSHVNDKQALELTRMRRAPTHRERCATFSTGPRRSSPKRERQSTSSTLPPYSRWVLSRRTAMQPQCSDSSPLTLVQTRAQPSATEYSGTYAINHASLGKLTERLSWLSTVLPASHQILFYLSRVPSGCTLEMRSVMPVVEAADRAAGLLPLALPTEGAPEQQIKLLLDHLKRTHKWRLDVVDVFKSEHLQEATGDDNTARSDGDTNELPLNVDKIVGTLVRLFQQGMQHSKREAEVFTFTHILQCWESEFLDKQPSFYEDPYAHR